MFRTASEFPHDNPELFDGVAWVCWSPCGVARPVVRREPELDEVSPRHSPAPLSIAPSSEPACSVATNAPPAPEPSGFDMFVRAVARVAMERGATRAAAGLTQLLTGDTLDESTLSEHARAALVACGVAIVTSTGLEMASSFAATLVAWRGVLRGEPVSLSECGDRTLDEWVAELVAAWLAPGFSVADARRHLRGAGVAAFGMLEAA